VKKISEEDLEKMKGKILGEGSERTCYLYSYSCEKCLKISKKKNCEQTMREIGYFQRLKKRNVKVNFLPEFYESFCTDRYVGYVQECFLSKANGGIWDVVSPLDQYIANTGNDIKMIREELSLLKKQMIESNVICCDLSTSNVLKVKNEEVEKLVVIDGVGYSELVPLCEYMRLIGRRKIERQWNKLENRISIWLEKRALK